MTACKYWTILRTPEKQPFIRKFEVEINQLLLCFTEKLMSVIICTVKHSDAEPNT